MLAVGPQRLWLDTPAGRAELPLYASRDWAKPQPDITRAVIVIHGARRDADVYFRIGEAALAASGDPHAMVIAPQFLAGRDIGAHHLPPDTLRWSLTGWEGGEPARGPAPVSSFDALDAILRRLGDHAFYPALRSIVVAGHSGGGQVVQRYAILTHADRALPGIHLRFVVANPSSYAWFTPERPVPFDHAACPGFDRWKYGMHGLPPYAGGESPAALEAAYAARDVVYLLGTADTDPAQSALDRSCAAEAQGPFRYARGMSYALAMQRRHPDGPAVRVLQVLGVGHSGEAMFTSTCGLAALFDRPGC